MNVKKFIAGVLACCVVGGVMPTVKNITSNIVITASAVDETEYTKGIYELLTYKNYGDYIEISACDDAAIEVVIPAEIDGVPVKSIGNGAFTWDTYSGCHSLTSVTIPNSITSIGERAFQYCPKLTSVTISNGVTSIGRNAFYGCPVLTSITIPESVTSIGAYAFYDSAWLKERSKENPLVTVNGIIVDATNCSGNVTIPEDITSITEGAFENCTGLTSITIPKNITIIEKRTFENCSALTSVTISESVTSIGASAFYGCTSLTSIMIPKNVTNIGNNVFENCSSLTSVTIPDSVTSIGNFAFKGCTGLTSINISENNENYANLDGSLFNKDKTVLISYPAGKIKTEYIIPDSVTSIEDSAFYGCTNLTSI